MLLGFKKGLQGLQERVSLGRAVGCPTALLQTRASTINAHGSSDYGFAGRVTFIGMNNPGSCQWIVDQQLTKGRPVHRPVTVSPSQPLAPESFHLMVKLSEAAGVPGDSVIGVVPA